MEVPIDISQEGNVIDLAIKAIHMTITYEVTAYRKISPLTFCDKLKLEPDS